MISLLTLTRNWNRTRVRYRLRVAHGGRKYVAARDYISEWAGASLGEVGVLGALGGYARATLTAQPQGRSEKTRGRHNQGCTGHRRDGAHLHADRRRGHEKQQRGCLQQAYR